MDKAKILLIDDEIDFLDMVREKLELEGYEVITAKNGEEGLDRARLARPDLIICDIMMPGKNGFEVLRNLKRSGDNRAPFVMLTVVNDFERIKEAYEDEADFYVTKPVELDKLINNVRVLLNLAGSKKNE